jgi:hypothetical protein
MAASATALFVVPRWSALYLPSRRGRLGADIDVGRLPVIVRIETRRLLVLGRLPGALLSVPYESIAFTERG